MYRNYSAWMLAMEPKLAWVNLSRAQFRFFVSGICAVSFLTALILVGRVEVIKDGYEIVALRQQRDKLMSEKLQNERVLRDLQSLDHVEAVARQDMHMVDVNPNEVIYLKDSTKPNALERFWHSLFGG
jgi:hypothetical protein